MLFILTSVWIFANRGVAFIALAFVIGIVMMLQGIVSVMAYFKKCAGKIHLSYILADGIIAFLLGITVITNRLVTDVEVPLFFGLAIIFTGTTRVMTSFNIGRRRVQMRKYLFMLGAFDIVFGMYMFYNASIAGIHNIVLVAVSFMLQGINVISAGIEMPKERSFINKHGRHSRRKRQRAAAEAAVKKSSHEMRAAARAIAEGTDMASEIKKGSGEAEKSKANTDVIPDITNNDEPEKEKHGIEALFSGFKIEKRNTEEAKIEELIDSMDWRKTLTSFEPIKMTDDEFADAVSAASGEDIEAENKQED